MRHRRQTRESKTYLRRPALFLWAGSNVDFVIPEVSLLRIVDAASWDRRCWRRRRQTPNKNFRSLKREQTHSSIPSTKYSCVFVSCALPGDAHRLLGLWAKDRV